MIAPARDDDEPAIDLRAVALALVRRRMSSSQIAEAIGVSRQTVYNWLTDARRLELLGRLPPPWEFGLRLNCTCREKPLRAGETIVCVWCGASGWDFHPGMHPDPKEAPKPERKSYKPGALKGGNA